MPHYKLLLDPGKFLGPADFPVEREVTIHRVAKEQMPTREKDEAKTTAPMLYVRTKEGAEYPRCFKVPKSVLHGLSLMLGTDTDGWVGQKISIFAAHCMSFGEKEECLRVRFTAEIDGKIRRWLKKRKASASTYILEPKESN